MRLHRSMLSPVVYLAAHFLRGIILLVLMCSLTFTQILFAPTPVAWAQTQPVIFSQDLEGGPVRPITPEELSQLKDPLFEQVLKEHAADATTLAQVIEQLDPDRQEIFVVDEHIVDATPQIDGRDAHRRAVITLDGQGQGQPLGQNVFFSVLFDSDEFPSSTGIEAMAWNEEAGEFNYYKLNRSNTDDPALTWKFRGTSKDADRLSATERQGTCMACHINGGPMMKELDLPWNNWHSFSDEIGYLETPFPGEPPRPDTWPVAQSTESPLRHLTGAETLETSIILPAIERFNDRRLEALVGKRDNISSQITEVKRLLKPLFVTTEVNLVSSRAFSNLHPFEPPSANNPTLNIPQSFFLNSRLMRSRFNLGAALDFSFAEIEGSDYQELVKRSETTLGQETPGDSNFAWFTPEASFIDNNFVEKLINRGVVPRSFVAAALTIDLENPVLSADRAAIWEADNILPDQIQTDPNDLTAQTIRNLEQLNLPKDSPQGQFLEALRDPDPVALLRSKVKAYSEREQRQFDNPQTRQAEAARLYGKLLKVRQAVLSDANLSRLDETRGEFLLALGDPDKLEDLINPPEPPKPDPPEPQQPTLARGTQGEAVRTLQQTLQTLGFLNGPADGDFGPMTEQAVRSAQQTLKLTVDGIVGPATWSAFDQVLAQPILRTGSRGDDVALLQGRLRNAGFFSVVVDGDFGPGTRRAVVSFQRRLGLVADGIVGPATWARLMA